MNCQLVLRVGMQKLYRILIALLISFGAFTLTFMTLSLDARIGKYEIPSQSSTGNDLGFLSKIYKENTSFQESENHQEEQSENTVFQLPYRFELDELPLSPLTYYAPTLNKRGLVILNSALLPNQNTSHHISYAPNLGGEQLIVNIPRHFLLPGQNSLTLLSRKGETTQRTIQQYLGPLNEIEKAHKRQTQITTWLPSIVTAFSLSLISLSIFGLLFSEFKSVYVGMIFANLSLAICSLGSGHSALSELIRSTQGLRTLLPCLLLSSLIGIGFSLWKKLETLSGILLGLSCFAVSGSILILFSHFTGISPMDEIFVSSLFLVSALPLLLHITISQISRDLADYSFTLSSLRRTINEQAIILDEKSRIIAEEMQRRAVFEERQRMMRDIHDGIGGQLLSLLLRVLLITLMQI